MRKTEQKNSGIEKALSEIIEQKTRENAALRKILHKLNSDKEDMKGNDAKQQQTKKS